MIIEVIGILCSFFNWRIFSTRCKQVARVGVSRVPKKEREQCMSGEK